MNQARVPFESLRSTIPLMLTEILAVDVVPTPLAWKLEFLKYWKVTQQEK